MTQTIISPTDLKSHVAEFERLYGDNKTKAVLYLGEEFLIAAISKSFFQHHFPLSPDMVGKPAREAYANLADPRLFTRSEVVYKTGQPFHLAEIPFEYTADPITGEKTLSYWSLSWNAWRIEGSRVRGVLIIGEDVTERVRLREQIQKQAEANYLKTVEVLERNARLLNTTLDIDDFFKALANQISELVECDIYSLLLADEEGKFYRHIICRYFTDNFSATDVTQFDFSHNHIIQQLLSVREPQVFQQPYKTRGWISNDKYPKVEIMLGYPVFLEGKLIAVQFVYRHNNIEFSEREISLFRIFSEGIKTNLSNLSLHRQTQELARIRAAVIKLSQTISATLNVQELLQVLINQVQEVMQVDHVWIALDEETQFSNRPEVKRLEKVQTGLLSNIKRMREGIGLIGKAWVSHKPVWTNDFTTDPEFQGDLYKVNREVAVAFNSKASLALPLMFENRCIGVILLAKKIVYDWRPADIELAQEVVNFAAIALQNAVLYDQSLKQQEKIERQVQVRKALLELSQKLSAELELAKVTNILVEQTKKIMGLNYVLLSLIENDKIVDHSRSYIPGEIRTTLVDLNEDILKGYGMTGVAYTTGEILVTENYNEDSRWQSYLTDNHRANAQTLGVVASIIIPLKSRDTKMGLLILTKSHKYTWTAEDIALAEEIASLASIAVQNARLYGHIVTQTELIEKHAQTRNALLVMAQNLATSLQLENILNTLIGSTQDLLRADLVQVALVSGDKLLDYPFQIIPSELERKGVDSILEGHGLSGLAFSHGQPVWTHNYYADERLKNVNITEANRRNAQILEAVAVLMIPILARNEKIGLLSITKSYEYNWTVEDIALGQEIASLAAFAIQNARLYGQLQNQMQETERHNMELEAVQAFNEQLRDLSSLEATLWRMVRVAVEVSGAFVASIRIREENSDEIKLIALYQQENPHLSYPGSEIPNMDVEKIEVLLRDEVVREVFHTGQPMLIENSENFRIKPVFTTPQINAHSVILLPLIIEGKVWGVLGLRWNRSGGFSPEQVRFASIVAEQISATIARVMLSVAREKQTQLNGALALARTVAHELNQQLTILQGLLELQDEDEPIDRETRQTFQNAITKMANQIKQYQRLNQVVLGELVSGVSYFDIIKSTKQ
jgi:GAF domain-containing protein